MAKVLFTVHYEIKNEKRNDFLSSIEELKSLIKADGILSYSIFESKGKKNHFEEVFIFDSPENFENYDDSENERVAILISKIEDLKVTGTTKYHTSFEV
ncbi:MAG: hypothetical protein C0425_00750 [Chlorobiaceae bacterium]|nr:hypothetical protein [Chlorobiaceae bacterium]MBA4308851.1 hypothetical protein [Chlorobiaceae bacterium]